MKTFDIGNGFWQDVDTPEMVEYAEEQIKKENCRIQNISFKMNVINKQGFINLFFAYVVIAVGFINTILKTKVLTTEEIGVMAIIASIATLVGFFINFGVPSGIVRYYCFFKPGTEEKTAFIIFVLAVPLLIFVFASIIIHFLSDYFISFYNNSLLNRYFKYIFYFLFGNLLITAFKQIIEAEFKTVHANIANDVIWRVIHFGFLMWMLFHDIEFHYYFIFIICTIFLRVVLLLLVFPGRIQIGRPAFTNINSKFIGDFFQYCIFMLFAGIAGVITTTIDRLMLGYFVDMSAVGIYSIMLSFASIINLSGSGFGRIAHPMIAELWTKNDIGRIHLIYRENANLQLFIGSFLFIAFLLFAKSFLSMLGNNYVSGYGVLIYLSAGQLINLGTGMCGGIIAYSKSSSFEFYLRIFLTVLTVITNLIFIPLWGVTGAAFATALSLSLYNLAKVGFVWVKFKIQPYNGETIKTITSAVLVCAMAAIFLSIINFPERLWIIIVLSIILFLTYILSSLYLLRISFVKTNMKDFIRYISKLTGKREQAQ